MKRKEVIKFLLIRTVGNFLVLFTIFGFSYTFGPALYYEINYRIQTSQGIKYQVANVSSAIEINKLVQKYEAPPSESLLTTADKPKEKIMIPKSTEFGIMIPKIAANAIVYANTDPANPAEYLEVLKKGVAHAKGSAFPGMNGTSYIFAHSTDNFWNAGTYNAIFFLLKELKAGDDIVIFFMDRRYNYAVSETKIVDPEEVSYLSANIGKGERLVLQTCWPPGTTLKRLMVIAEPLNK